MKSQTSELLAIISELWGQYCCRPSSIVETPKTSLRSSIDVRMDVMRVSWFVVVKECDSVLVGEKVQSRTDFGKARAI